MNFLGMMRIPNRMACEHLCTNTKGCVQFDYNEKAARNPTNCRLFGPGRSIQQVPYYRHACKAFPYTCTNEKGTDMQINTIQVGPTENKVDDAYKACADACSELDSCEAFEIFFGLLTTKTAIC